MIQRRGFLGILDLDNSPGHSLIRWPADSEGTKKPSPRGGHDPHVGFCISWPPGTQRGWWHGPTGVPEPTPAAKHRLKKA